MIHLKLLSFVVGVVLLASSYAEDVDTEDFQCRILYEHNASKKGTVSSPFYGKRQEYHNGLWCEYRIRAPRRYRIKITFKDFDIQPSGSCAQDKLVVYGKNKESVIGLFCGNDSPLPILSNEGENEIRLLFQTDFMAGGRGFLIEYESAPKLEYCKPGYTVCHNRQCYDNRRKCDGVDDCGDGTDEEDCGFPIVTEPSDCGVPKIQPRTVSSSADRIVGGEAVTPHSWPWMVSINSAWSEPSGHFCGGTLINAQWVLTASHCIGGYSDPKLVKLKIGSHHKYKKSAYEQTRRAIKIIAYPDLEGERMRGFSWSHDLALIKLNAPVKFNDGVQPACVPQLGWQLNAGQRCYSTGWGESRGSGSASVLKQTEIFVQSQEECPHNTKLQICVGKWNNSPCHGDSGGPLQCKVGNKWYVFGATSTATMSNFMSGLCVGPGSKAIYTNVPDKAEWVRAIVNKYS